MRHSI